MACHTIIVIVGILHGAEVMINLLIGFMCSSVKQCNASSFVDQYAKQQCIDVSFWPSESFVFHSRPHQNFQS